MLDYYDCMIDGPNHWNDAQFKGQYFESQTEAAWAAYFDALGMPYVREPETFLFDFEMDFIGNIKYTPDFYLSDQDTYAEVKNGNVERRDIVNMHYLAKCTGRAVLLLGGKPQYGHVDVYSPTHVLRDSSLWDTTANYSYWMSDLWQDKEMGTVKNPIIKAAVEASKEEWTVRVDPAVREAALHRREEMRKNPTRLKVVLG